MSARKPYLVARGEVHHPDGAITRWHSIRERRGWSTLWTVQHPDGTHTTGQSFDNVEATP